MDKRTTKGHFTRIRNIEAYKETSYTPPRQAALRITESYYNYTGKVLYLAHRNNILFPLAMEDRHMNMPQQHVGKLVIEQQFLVAYDRVDEFINQLMLDVEEDTENHNIEQHRVIEAITGGDHIEKHRSGLQFTVRYVIGGKAIQTQPNGLYITNLDVAIGFEGTDVIHPYAARTAASIYNQYQKNQKEAPRSNFTVMLVDNAGRYNSLYINIHGDAMEIKPTRSENMEDGIWVSRSSHTRGSVSETDAVFIGGPSRVRYDTLACLDGTNFETPMLYYSMQECITHGDALVQLEKRYQLDKARADIKAKEQEERIKQQEEARKERDHQRKMEEMERKARLDRVKDERSVGVEVLKIGGALVTGIGIALAAMAKMRD